MNDLEAQPWYKRAACLKADADSFFPERGGDSRQAKRICQTCPVQPECLEYALTNDERFGIWGGLSERERRRLRRGPRPAGGSGNRVLRPRPKLTHCPKEGHPLEGDNLLVEGSGHRRCRKCRNETAARYKERMAS